MWDGCSLIVKPIDEPFARIKIAVHAIDSAIGEREVVVIARIGGRCGGAHESVRIAIVRLDMCRIADAVRGARPPFALPPPGPRRRNDARAYAGAAHELWRLPHAHDFDFLHRPHRAHHDTRDAVDRWS